MVFGILVIILGILGIAVWGNDGNNERIGHAATSLTAPGGVGEFPPPIKPSGDDIAKVPDSPANDDITPIDIDDPQRSNGAVPYVSDDVPVNPGEKDPTVDPEPVNPEPENPEPVALPDYIVKPGDNLEKIAKSVYGDRKFVADIQKANGNLNPQKIYAGQVLKMPTIADAAAAKAKNSASKKDESAKAPSAPTENSAIPKTYTIGPGDNLVKIARRFFGDDVTKVQAIRNLNKDVIKDPNKLPVGKTIKLP